MAQSALAPAATSSTKRADSSLVSAVAFPASFAAGRPPSFPSCAASPAAAATAASIARLAATRGTATPPCAARLAAASRAPGIPAQLAGGSRSGDHQRGDEP